MLDGEGQGEAKLRVNYEDFCIISGNHYNSTGLDFLVMGSSS